ncbi:MAG TPA: hypothetical protein VGN81_36920 [Pseudonocardiaceae bacterium]|jgi:hypothetical protein
MRAARALAIVLTLTALGAVACSFTASTPAPADQLATLCANARDQVNAVPSVAGDEDNTVSAPKFDQQHTIAATLEPRLRAAAVCWAPLRRLPRRLAAKQAGLTACTQIPWRNWKTQ